MEGNSKGGARAFQPPRTVEEVGIEPSYAGLTGHAYLKGKI